MKSKLCVDHCPTLYLINIITAFWETVSQCCPSSHDLCCGVLLKPIHQANHTIGPITTLVLPTHTIHFTDVTKDNAKRIEPVSEREKSPSYNIKSVVVQAGSDGSVWLVWRAQWEVSSDLTYAGESPDQFSSYLLRRVDNWGLKWDTRRDRACHEA